MGTILIREHILSTQRLVGIAFLLLSVVTSLFLMAIRHYLLRDARVLFSEIEDLTTRLLEVGASSRSGYLAKSQLGKDLERALEQYIALHITFSEQQERLRSSEQITKLARQVAHDIRSPVGALEIVLSGDDNTYLGGRDLVRMASSRIKKIADDLLIRSSTSKTLAMAGYCEVDAVVDQIIREKLLLKDDGVKLESRLGLGKARARIDGTLLGRIVSNLLNNSLEAIDEVGEIQVTTGRSGDLLSLKISDTGKGMKSEVLSLAGEVEISHGKQGFGLGLSHAVRTIRDVGGELKIESELGHGTSIEVLLPAEAG